MFENVSIDGCSGCATTGGRFSCSVHGGFVQAMGTPLVAGLEMCKFCPCDRGFSAAPFVTACGCPCHWRNSLQKEKMLEAVRYFFGGELR